MPTPKKRFDPKPCRYCTEVFLPTRRDAGCCGKAECRKKHNYVLRSGKSGYDGPPADGAEYRPTCRVLMENGVRVDKWV